MLSIGSSSELDVVWVMEWVRVPELGWVLASELGWVLASVTHWVHSKALAGSTFGHASTIHPPRIGHK